MHGLVSLLPPPYYGQVEALWRELEDEHELRGISVTPLPHFSWQIAEDYDLDRLEQVIGEIGQVTPPFQVRTAGLALFTGPRPVIYIPVVKDEGLLRLHAMIWDRAQSTAEGLSPYYSPIAWIPHISLAYEDVNPQNIGPVMGKLAFRQFNWEMTIDNIALIFEPAGQVGAQKFRIQLKG